MSERYYVKREKVVNYLENTYYVNWYVMDRNLPKKENVKCLCYSRREAREVRDALNMREMINGNGIGTFMNFKVEELVRRKESDLEFIFSETICM